MPGKINNLQAIRGAALIMVIVYHAYIMDLLYQDGTLFPGWMNFGAIGVDIFFVLSGFIIVMISYGRAGDASYVPKFLLNRVVRIVPLYWLLTAAVLVFASFKPEMVNTSSGHRIDPIASFLFLPSDVLPLVHVGWTLVYEVHFYLLFAVILLLPRRFMPLVVAGLAGLVLLLGVLLRGQEHPYLVLISSPFILEFLAGWALGLWMIMAQPQRGGWPVLAASLVLFAIGGVVYEQLAPGQGYQPWPRVLAFLVPSVLLIYAGFALERHQNVVASRLWVFLGDASYSIYLVHILGMHFVGRFIWPRLDPLLGDMSAPLMVLANLTVGLASGIVCYFIIERPMEQRLRRATAGLSSKPATREQRT